MAQQLMCEGQDVALLAFLDTFNPGPAVHRDTNRGRLRKLVERGPSYAMSRARWLWDTQIRDGVKRVRVDYYTRRGLTIPLELRDFHIFESFHQVQARYRPQVYPGGIVLFRAAEIAGAFAHVGPVLGWDGLAEQGIEVHEIPGNHDTLVVEPNVEVLVRRLKASLEAAQKRAVRAPLTDQHLVRVVSGR
jgi:thioesterase domain-containing protein